MSQQSVSPGAVISYKYTVSNFGTCYVLEVFADSQTIIWRGDPFPLGVPASEARREAQIRVLAGSLLYAHFKTLKTAPEDAKEDTP